MNDNFYIDETGEKWVEVYCGPKRNNKKNESQPCFCHTSEQSTSNVWGSGLKIELATTTNSEKPMRYKIYSLQTEISFLKKTLGKLENSSPSNNTSEIANLRARFDETKTKQNDLIIENTNLQETIIDLRSKIEAQKLKSQDNKSKKIWSDYCWPSVHSNSAKNPISSQTQKTSSNYCESQSKIRTQKNLKTCLQKAKGKSNQHIFLWYQSDAY